MKYILFSLAALTLCITPALADHNGRSHGPLYSIKVDVSGLVCDFCARALEKIFYRRNGVEGVDVNLDTHIVTIDIAKGTEIPDDEITKLVTEAGYNVIKITR